MDPHEIRRMATYEMQHGGVGIEDDEFREIEKQEEAGKSHKGGGKSDYVRSVVSDPSHGGLADHYERLVR